MTVLSIVGNIPADAEYNVEAGRFPSLPAILCVDPEVPVGKTLPRDNGPKTPRHRVSCLWRCTGCHPAHKRATNRLTTRNRGLRGFGCGSNRDGQLLAEKILPKKSVADLSVFETFWEHCLIGRVLLSDYSVVIFLDGLSKI